MKACRVWALCLLTVGQAAAQAIPPDAARYRADLTRQARMIWGIDAPVADFAGQIHQESRWRPDAKSHVGAGGLAQFMPATAKWISGIDPLLASNAPYNPTWAIRGLVVYDRWLYDRLPKAGAGCIRLALALRAYNGGLGYLHKEAKAVGSWSPALMETACRKFRSAASCRENTEYPHRILLQHSPKYQRAGWGLGYCDTP